MSGLHVFAIKMDPIKILLWIIAVVLSFIVQKQNQFMKKLDAQIEKREIMSLSEIWPLIPNTTRTQFHDILDPLPLL